MGRQAAIPLAPFSIPEKGLASYNERNLIV
jgi:hypothetical protein